MFVVNFISRQLTICFALVASISLVACGESSSAEDDENEIYSCSSADIVNSSSSISSSSSSKIEIWDIPKKSFLNSNIEYGTIKDTRDGHEYKTTKIGEQIWMAENLNYADSVKTPSLIGKSWCFYNDTTNCKNIGRLYTWAAAIDSVSLANDVDDPQICGYKEGCNRLMEKALAQNPIQGICPDGWHLPSHLEWKLLIETIGGQSGSAKALKSSSGWKDSAKGTDDYGFSAIPAGNRSNNGFFEDAGRYVAFWSSTQNKYAGDKNENTINCDLVYIMSLNDLTEDVDLHEYFKELAFSVRCIKDSRE